MIKHKPTYRELERRVLAAEPIVEALRRNEVDAVVGEEKIAVLLLHEVGAALQDSDAGFRALFELSGVGMVQADTPSFHFTKVNQKFCQIVGYSDEELMSQTYIGLTDPRDRRRDMKSLSRVLHGKADSWAIEKRCVRKDGNVVWLGVNGTALRNDEGRAVRVLAMINDITAHKEAQQLLQDRSDQLGRLASELTVAEQRERGRIARMLNDHIKSLLIGAQSRSVPMEQSREKTVRQVLKDLRDFIDQSISTPRPRAPAPPNARLKPATRTPRKETTRRKEPGRPRSKAAKKT